MRGEGASILAIDTASRTSGWVMVTDRDGAAGDVRRLEGGGLDRSLPAAVAELVPVGLEAVVVLTGPGSYTGVRGGMAAALGVAAARGVPLHGVGNLVAVAAAAAATVEPGRRFLTVADAGRGGVYHARFEVRDGFPVQLTAVERGQVEEVAVAALPLVTATAGLGAAVRLVAPEAALAAAVPVALALPPLEAIGLSATHAGNAVATGRARSV